MLETTTPSVAKPAYIIVLNVHLRSGDLWKTSAKLPHSKVFGQRSGDRAWLDVISAVSVMKTTGARNASPAAIRRLCSATETRKRCRLTARGSFRRSKGAATALIERLPS